eukprot:4714397-Pyramimonas_sp.AAC.1
MVAKMPVIAALAYKTSIGRKQPTKLDTQANGDQSDHTCTTNDGNDGNKLDTAAPPSTDYHPTSKPQPKPNDAI